ncbi:MAG: response regulator [Treponema sp.]|jgi:putative two-component system response regulator|nr:response regulator [Treponema sp.]
MKTIFAVDDSDINLLMAKKALEGSYGILTMSSAARMFTLLEKIIPDLILLDISMPGMNGFEALQCLKSNPLYADIPVIFLTGNTDTVTESRGFELGVVDFIAKPFSRPVLLNRVKTHLDIDELIRARMAQIRRLQNGIVTVLADVVEERDKETGGHNSRTAEYVKILIKAMEERGVYADEIGGWDIDITVLSARLHDVGKIHVLDIILNKPGKLDSEEYEKMKLHTTDCALIIDRMIKQTGEEEFLRYAKLFTEYHHERWDGMGYPHGLAGTDIPLQGRIMAIADVYDALVSFRPYKEAFTNEEAVQIINTNAGSHFDPKIVEVFLEVKDEFKAVKEASSQQATSGKSA